MLKYLAKGKQINHVSQNLSMRMNPCKTHTKRLNQMYGNHIRMFSAQKGSAVDDLEQRAMEIQASIDQAKANIEEGTKVGIGLARGISEDVQEDKFIKMQRYEIFISKMEQLQRREKTSDQKLRSANYYMQNSYVNSPKPLKDILYNYNKESHKRGFDSQLVSNTLEQLQNTLRARGNLPRPYDDYTTREFDISWRMQTLASHLKTALQDEQYFNHFHMGNCSRKIGQIGYKDAALIQKFFDKLNKMLDERNDGGIKHKDGLNYETSVYGSFLNFIPRHHVFDGFETHQEFKQHLTTLLSWQTAEKTVLTETSDTISDLQVSMGRVVQAANQMRDVQVNFQASIDSLRQQYFKLMEAHDKNKFMEENKFIRLELLELQDQLIQAGYLDPDEAENAISNHPYEVRMERASQIFYDYCQNYAPNMLSPQYDQFYKAGQESVAASPMDQTQPTPLDETHDYISLSSLSQTLIGLNQQALSFRLEAEGHDYLNPFYEKQCLNLREQVSEWDQKIQDHQKDELDIMYESEHVKMDRDYLKAWDIFERESEKMWPRVKKLAQQSQDDLEGQLYGLHALCAIKVHGQDLRDDMCANIERLLGEGKEARLTALLDGLSGLAHQGNIKASQTELGKKLLKLANDKLQPLPEHGLTFDQKIDLMWAACALKIELESPVIQDLYANLNLLNFQRTDNDLTYYQYHKVRDILIYLNRVSPAKNQAWTSANMNPALKLILKHPDLHEKRYFESDCNYDPFKKRVLLGMSQGLTMASIDHQLILESNLVNQADFDINFNDDRYPYKPDLVIGWQGQKVLMEVLPSSKSMRDNGKPDGEVQFRQSILRSLNSDRDSIQTVGIPIRSIVDYDIANMHVNIKPGYNFLQDLQDQIDSNQEAGSQFNTHIIDFEDLAKFGAKFTKQAGRYVSNEYDVGNKQRIDTFFKQLYKLFQHKHHAEKQYEKVVYQQGLDAIKVELMKTQLLYDSLPKEQQEYLEQFIEGQSFEKMISKQREKINLRIIGSEAEETDSQLNLDWVGTRQEVELPTKSNSNVKKNLAPEFVNQRFMWVDDYFHYKDWEVKMKDTFDSFNLLELPKKKNDTKYFYDRAYHQRMIPQFILPNPNQKRQISQAQFPEFNKQLTESTEQKSADFLNQFEKDPFKMMINKELQNSESKKPIDRNMSFITNLQNMKQGLKSDFSDAELVSTLFSKLDLTDALIKEHISKPNFNKQQDNKDVFFVNRDPAEFRNFVMSTYHSKDQEDPFTHFYIKEAAKIERVHKLKGDADERYEQISNNREFKRSTMAQEEAGKIMKTLADKMDDMLLENWAENEDFTSLSHQLPSEVKVDYNMSSLMKSEYVYDIDPDLVNDKISDKQYLSKQRRRAETKLIKGTIIYKMDQQIPLSENENAYLKSWYQAINGRNTNIFNVRDSMLPYKHSGLSIEKALSAEDIYTLNTIPNVELINDKKHHGKNAVNDIVLELSHLIDEDIINRIEHEMISKKLRKSWNLPKNFQIVETRNKEIGNVINELEEVAWRMSGMFDQQEIETIKAMFSIKRNQDAFDRHYYDIDMKSMQEFIAQANTYDDRVKLLEEWLVRKEEEIKSRVVLAPESMKKSDQELHSKVDAQLKKARENLVANFLIEEDGRKVQKTKKKYVDLTTPQLAQIVESLSVRLNLFNGQYPAFMPHAIRAVMEHPNITKADQDKLDGFCKIFELDWRGDRSATNKAEFLGTHPIYLNQNDRSNFNRYGELGNYEVSAMLRQACIPFVESLTDQMIQEATKKTEKVRNDDKA